MGEEGGGLAGLGHRGCGRQHPSRARCGDSIGGSEGQAPKTEPFMAAVTETFEKKQIKKLATQISLKSIQVDGVHVALL